MKLTYRGTPYQLPIAPIDAPKRPIVGRYRGHRCEISPPVPARPAPHPLKYRGIAHGSAIDTAPDFPGAIAIVTRGLRAALLLASAFLTAAIVA